MRKIRPISKTGVSRHGRNAGSIVRLKFDCKAFANSTSESRRRYDEIDNRKLSEAKAWIHSFGGTLLESDSLHNSVVVESSNPLPDFTATIIPEVTENEGSN